MLVVKCELWPQGNNDEAESLGTLVIVNDGTGSKEIGHYLTMLDENMGEGVATGVVRGFEREKKPAWELVYRALTPLVGRRN